jgi:DNA polymerase I
VAAPKRGARRAPAPVQASGAPSGADVLLLLDGHSLAYRAFFALPQTLATSTGQVTNAVYGFTSMLLKLLGEVKTERLAVAFDLGRPTIRLAEYAEYKAGRAETPSEFKSQLPLLREVLETLGVPIFEVTEYEADDVLATLARKASEAGLDSVIVTADRDFLQLVRPGCTILFNRRGVSDIVHYDEAAVEERFGLPPSKLRDLVALKGDPSDNLPGVPGIGEKTAAALIKQFSSIEELYEHLDQVPPRHRANLEQARDQVFQNKKLNTLHDSLAIDIDPTTIRMSEWNMDAIRSLFNSLEFRSLYERLHGLRAPVATGPEVFVAREARSADLPSILAGARERGRVAIVPAGAGIALALSDEEVVWLPDASAASDLLADASIAKVVHGAKRLTAEGIDFDTEIAAYLLDPATGSYDLETITQRYLGRDLPTARPPDDGGQMSLDMGSSADEAQAASACAAVLLPLADHLAGELERLGMLRLYRDIEMPLVAVLARMERTGVAIDVPLLEKMSSELGSQVDEIEKRIYEAAGGPFNLNSPPQLREVLYDRLGLSPGRKTKTGYSTDAAALESLRGQHPIIDEMLHYRELSKLKSTYLDALPPLIDPADGRLHATFNQVATSTGRISSENPNVQNIPVRTELGRQIRRAFVAGFPEHVLVVADYSQIELRVMAHVTRDEGLLEAFAKDEDIHTATAAKVFGFRLDEVPKDLRNRAKMINYGLSYGMSAYGLAQRLGIPTDEAAEFIDAYFKGFPGVAEFMERVVRDAQTDGYTVTLLGRRRYLPELGHANPRVRSLGERMALNAPIQGTAADIIKLAMLKVSALPTARMVLTVHDELIFEVPRSERNDTVEAVRSLMEQAYPLAVPLKVDIATGSSWAEAKG